MSFKLFNKYFNVVSHSKNKKLIFGSLLLAFLIVTMFCMEVYSAYKSEMMLARVQVSNLNQVLEGHIAGSFKKIDLMLLNLQDKFENSQEFEKPSKEQNDFLQQLKKRLPEILSIKIVDSNGKFLADDLGVISTKNISDRDYFQQMKRESIDQLIISKPVISKTANRWVVVLSRPILSKSGEFRGLILATIPIEYLQNMFSKLNVGSKGAISLIDTDQYLYARKPSADVYGKKMLINDELKDFLNSDKKNIEFRKKSKFDNVNRVIGARKLENYHFSVIVGLSVDEFLLDWKIRTCTNLFVIVFFLAISAHFLFNFLFSLEQLEEQRKQSIQAAKLSSLGEMASGIAHEINNPLTIISAYARSLKRSNNEGSNDQKINVSADKIILTVDRIARIIKGLRSFARDSFNDPVEPVSVQKIVDMSLELCLEKLKDHSIELRKNTFLDVEIDCNEIQIAQVLVNILNNSRDAIEGIENKWIEICVKDFESYILIEISDSGKRISNEVAEKIMQPFFTTKEIGKGVGLGLSISKGIIENHHGEFYLDRSVKQNTFVMKLPKSVAVKKQFKIAS
jgi:signal transduction histidine kinase